ncbi:MAG: GIY-YIG nuclease family protein [Planctomycetaceae bacterium]|nr:GIY-YIG nuclease family protein [Planctomycetaceae bacterium]
MKQVWTTYVLRSIKNGQLYIGLTDNLERRLLQHNRGYNLSTRGRGPFVVIHSEVFPSRIQARQRERELKTGSGREWIRNNYPSCE